MFSKAVIRYWSELAEITFFDYTIVKLFQNLKLIHFVSTAIFFIFLYYIFVTFLCFIPIFSLFFYSFIKNCK